MSNPFAQFLDTGSFVIMGASIISWQSFHYPTDTVISGMKLGWNLTSRLNRNLTSWSSPTDPSPGNYTLTLNLHCNPELYFWNGPVLQWRSGPWTGYDFSNHWRPITLTYTDTYIFNFVNNNEEVYYSVDVVNKSDLARLVVNESGSTQRCIWLHESRVWNLYWYHPSAQCDDYGMCDSSSSPMCSCLQGFEPKLLANWALRYTSDGRVRKSQFDCRNLTAGFVAVHRTQLPDKMSASVDMDMSLDECRAECLENCSCTGFAMLI